MIGIRPLLMRSLPLLSLE